MSVLDPKIAMKFGDLVKFACSGAKDDLGAITAGTSIFDYFVLSKIYGNDLVTDLSPLAQENWVTYGYVLVDAAGNFVIAFRGTEGIWEWVHDAMFLLAPCPIQGAVGSTHDGISLIFKSLTLEINSKISLVDAFSVLKGDDCKSVTVCGHSLGGALATLAGYDLALNSRLENISVYSYASPRIGDEKFVFGYNVAVPNTFRIANRLDLVPKLPLPPFFEHVEHLIDLTPTGLVWPEIACEHALDTYMYLLSKLPGAAECRLPTHCSGMSIVDCWTKRLRET